MPHHVSNRSGTFRRQVPPARRIAAHPDHDPHRLRRAGPRLLAAARRLQIRATLDEANRAISGAETITYHNNSPDTLNYLWVQLDQNIYKPNSDARTTPPCARATPGTRRAARKTA
jgi:hypothetical protein